MRDIHPKKEGEEVLRLIEGLCWSVKRRKGYWSITIPEFRRAVLPIGLSNAILKQAEIEEDNL